MWGTRKASRRLRSCTRFIPTLVGNTRLLIFLMGCETVHPHACGEHGCRMLNTGFWTGSSPRLWGTLCRFATGFLPWRFIPTLVGNTLRGKTCLTRQMVHPHACGEHRLSGNGGIFAIGSSPRLWGTRPTIQAVQGRYRFIPTLVGNTLNANGFDYNISVHPHACGEHIVNSGQRSRKSGSSPRLWGTLLRIVRIG